jgi:hypothetical protein
MRTLVQYPLHRRRGYDPFLRLVFALKWNAVKNNVLLSRSIEGCMIVQTRAENAILYFPIRVIPLHRTFTDEYLNPLTMRAYSRVSCRSPGPFYVDGITLSAK